jgi:hypothetical protein
MKLAEKYFAPVGILWWVLGWRGWGQWVTKSPQESYTQTPRGMGVRRRGIIL